ncbi:MAG: CerR family C-terminal domain-containing protein [Planctomycetes bacterium]|nr:CerR family C-terminal domain-containing protein [Planctomycetota bacterium]
MTRPPPEPAPRTAPRRRDARATRARLLASAGEVFAQHGFRDANLRQICAHARANLGAVRYYFGGKQALYREAFFAAYREVFAGEPMPRLADDDDPAAALSTWMRWFLRMLLIRRAAHPYLSRLLARELAQPSEVLDEIVALVVAPARDELERVVAALIDADARSREVEEKTHLVIFLCLQFEMAQPVLERLGVPRSRTPEAVDALAGRLLRFALAGLRA